MKSNNIEMFKGKTVESVEFDSLNEFYNYITNTPFNKTFCWSKHSSVDGTKEFTDTESFEEAVELFKSGWSDMATNLVKKLKVIENKTQPTMKPKSTLSVCGYQAVVPLYLQGVPNNMVNKKMVPVKQKVITLNKSINYSCMITTEQIIEESIKTLQIIKKLEAQGYRCNLNILFSVSESYGNTGKRFAIKVRIKSANEKLNVSKLAFPLVHPSMLRRLFFRFIEVYPNVTENFKHGYGFPMKDEVLRKANFHKNGEYLLPAFITKNIDEISSIDDLV